MNFEDFLKDCAKRLNEQGVALHVRLVPAVSVDGKVRFYAHPQGVDGKTVDYDVVGDTLVPIGQLVSHEIRSVQMLEMGEAELAITEAMAVIERSGASPQLTDAVNLLIGARNAAEDHRKGEKAFRRSVLVKVTD